MRRVAVLLVLLALAALVVVVGRRDDPGGATVGEPVAATDAAPTPAAPPAPRAGAGGREAAPRGASRPRGTGEADLAPRGRAPPEGGPAPHVDARAAKGPVIAVTDAEGRPLADAQVATVRKRRDDGDLVESAGRTDASGRVALGDAPLADRWVVVGGDGFLVAVLDGATAAGAGGDATRLVRAPTLAVDVVLDDDRTPCAEASVVVEVPPPDLAAALAADPKVAWPAHDVAYRAWARVDAAGHADVSLPSTGVVRVRVAPMDGRSYADPDGVVGVAPRGPMRFTVRRGARLVARFVEAADGAPIAGSFASWLEREGGGDLGTYERLVAGPGGEASVGDGVRPGAYVLAVERDGYRRAEQRVEIAAAGETPTVVVRLERTTPKGARATLVLEVPVAGKRGTPWAALTPEQAAHAAGRPPQVFLAPHVASDRTWDPAGSIGELTALATERRVTVEDLEPGRYDVMAFDVATFTVAGFVDVDVPGGVSTTRRLDLVPGTTADLGALAGPDAVLRDVRLEGDRVLWPVLVADGPEGWTSFSGAFAIRATRRLVPAPVSPLHVAWKDDAGVEHRASLP